MYKKKELNDFSWIGRLAEKAPSDGVIVIGYFALLLIIRGLVSGFNLPSAFMMLPSFFTVLLSPFYERKLSYSILTLHLTLSLTALVIGARNGEGLDLVGDSVTTLLCVNVFILLVSEFFYQVIGYFKRINCELEIAKYNAEAATEAKNHFLTNISHEIRTPISGIIGMTQMRLTLAKDKEETTQLKMLLESSDKLLNIVNNVLDYSKIESDELCYSLHTFSLSELLKELFREFSFIASSKGIKLQFVDSGDVPEYLLSDRYKLRTVLHNLIQNAITYTDEGYVTLLVKRMPSFGSSEEIHFSVKDTGIGIDSRKLDQVLNAFEQGDSSLTKTKDGVGLGLAVSSRLIEGLGGTLRIESEVDMGSTFSFIITSETVDANFFEIDGLYSVPNNCDPLLKKHILLAEDNKVNQTYMVHFLESKNYKVTVVNNGKEAIEAFREGTFSAVLMDIQMPVLSGLDATQQIRKFELERNLPQVPIIAVTASVTGTEVKRYKEYGINHFCPKPIDLSKMYTLLNEVVLSS